MSEIFADWQRKYDLKQGADFQISTLVLDSGWKMITLHSLAMLNVSGIILKNCLKNGKASGKWYEYDVMLGDPNDTLAVLCNQQGGMHVFIHASSYYSRQGVEMKICVGKRNDAPIPGYFSPIFNVLHKTGWNFNENCNEPHRIAEGRKGTMTHRKTRAMLGAFRALPVRPQLEIAENIVLSGPAGAGN